MGKNIKKANIKSLYEHNIRPTLKKCVRYDPP